MVLGAAERVSGGDALEDASRRYEAERDPRKSSACWDLLRRDGPDLSQVRTIMDVGCGTGSFLDLARQSGLDTAGVEPAGRAAEASARKGHRVFRQSIQEPLPQQNCFDIAVMWDVLEHLSNPGLALRNVAASLKPGGSLFILTTLAGSVYDRMGALLYHLSGGRTDRLLRMCWSYDHVFRYDPQGLCNTLRHMGFTHVWSQKTLLLSLRADTYAGGQLLASWTGRPAVDHVISRSGVLLAKALRLHNKVLVRACWGGKHD